MGHDVPVVLDFSAAAAWILLPETKRWLCFAAQEMGRTWDLCRFGTGVPFQKRLKARMKNEVGKV